MATRTSKWCAATATCAIVGCAAVGLRHGGAARAAQTPAANANGVAVVELFTSQGCSSCPPAERVMTDLAKAAESDGKPVYTLAFHVDYWDRLGWKDPYSTAAYSTRQYDYAKTLHLDQVYTPQMVVNGTAEFNGSDRDKADRSIAGALAAAAPARVTETVAAAAKDGYSVKYTAAGAGDGATVNVALVEQGLSTAVKAGENAGSQLDEPSVVRWFKSVPAAAAGEVAVPAVDGLHADHASVVTFVQRKADGQVLGATAAPLPKN